MNRFVLAEFQSAYSDKNIAYENTKAFMSSYEYRKLRKNCFTMVVILGAVGGGLAYAIKELFFPEQNMSGFITVPVIITALLYAQIKYKAGVKENLNQSENKNV